MNTLLSDCHLKEVFPSGISPLKARCHSIILQLSDYYTHTHTFLTTQSSFLIEYIHYIITAKCFKTKADTGRIFLLKFESHICTERLQIPLIGKGTNSLRNISISRGLLEGKVRCLKQSCEICWNKIFSYTLQWKNLYSVLD